MDGSIPVICLVGMPGSGKSELAEGAKILGCDVVRIGDRVWEEVEARGLDINPDNVGAVADEMRKERGMGVWAERTADYMDTLWFDKVKAVLIDGVRNWEEIEVFRQRYGANVYILAVHSSPQTRYSRLIARGRADDPEGKEALNKARERDMRELSWGIGRVIAMADVMIVNEGSIGDLHANFDRALHAFISQTREGAAFMK